MNVLGKLRLPEGRQAGPVDSPRLAAAPSQRRSNGLKDFLWLMPEAAEGRLLDLGPVAQSTVSFFIDRGFRVSIEDLGRSSDDFEAEIARERGNDPSAEPPDPSVLAAKFLERNLRFEPESFHGVLAWDIFDYLEAELLHPLAARLHELLAPGGVLLAAFHD